MLATSRWSAYRARNAFFKSSTHKASISSIYLVPANQRFTAPICPSAARVPTSADSNARTAGLVGASESGSARSEEHTSELQSRPHLVCRLLLEKKKKNTTAES